MPPIIVVPYDPQWPKDFLTIKAELEPLLNGIPVISIEHVGSTSVLGLRAKPIIDVDVVVSRDIVTTAIEALTTEEAGYTYMGEWQIPDRHVLRLLVQHQREPTRNLYVCVDGCQALKNHLGVRDVLRRDDAL